MPLSNPLHADTVAEIRTLHTMVKENEWAPRQESCPRSCCSETKYCCWMCGNEEEQGHKEGCTLQTALLNIGTFLDMQEEAL